MLVFVSFHISKTLNSSKRGLNIRFHIPDRKSSFVFVLVLIFVIVFIVVFFCTCPTDKKDAHLSHD